MFRPIELGPTATQNYLLTVTPPGADPGFFAGGGVNDGRVLRAPLPPAPTGGGGGLGLINIRLRYSRPT